MLYFLKSDSADGTATYNFNSAQTTLPGFDTQSGHAYASFLLGAVQTSSRPVQIVNNSYYQNNYDFYVQDDYKVTPKLTLNLGVRWQILPGLYRGERLRHQPRSDAAQRRGGQPARRPALCRQGRQEDVHRHLLRPDPAAAGRRVRAVAQDGHQRGL